jgi:hypothetical protein
MEMKLMPHLLVVILDDLSYMPELLHRCREIGVPGVTILASVGSYRASNWLGRVGLGAFDRLFEAEEVRRRTLLVAIEDDELLATAIIAPQALASSLSEKELCSEFRPSCENPCAISSW